MIRPYLMIGDRMAVRHYGAQLVDALSKHCEPTFVCPTELGKYVRSNARVITFDQPKHKFYPSCIRDMAGIVKQMRREKADIIHFLHATPILTMFQPFMRFCPVVLTWHDVTLHPGDRQKLFNLNRRLTTKMADAVTVHGEHLKIDLVALYPDLAQKVHIVPHGTITLFADDNGDQLTQEQDNVLFFGRIREYKGIDVFLRAAKLIHEQMPHITFTLAGEGDMSRYAGLIAETRDYVEVDNRIIPDELIPVLFNRAKVISLPYIEGSASGVLALAHGFGKPSVTTGVGSIVESVEDNVTDLLVPPGDHLALAEATMRLLKDETLRAKLSAGIREKVQTELSYDQVALLLLNIYEDLMRKKSK